MRYLICLFILFSAAGYSGIEEDAIISRASGFFLGINLKMQRRHFEKRYEKKFLLKYYVSSKDFIDPRRNNLKNCGSVFSMKKYPFAVIPGFSKPWFRFYGRHLYQLKMSSNKGIFPVDALAGILPCLYGEGISLKTSFTTTPYRKILRRLLRKRKTFNRNIRIEKKLIKLWEQNKWKAFARLFVRKGYKRLILEDQNRNIDVTLYISNIFRKEIRMRFYFHNIWKRLEKDYYMLRTMKSKIKDRISIRKKFLKIFQAPERDCNFKIKTNRK